MTLAVPQQSLLSLSGSRLNLFVPQASLPFLWQITGTLPLTTAAVCDQFTAWTRTRPPLPLYGRNTSLGLFFGDLPVDARPSAIGMAAAAAAAKEEREAEGAVSKKLAQTFKTWLLSPLLWMPPVPYTTTPAVVRPPHIILHVRSPFGSVKPHLLPRFFFFFCLSAQCDMVRSRKINVKKNLFQIILDYSRTSPKPPISPHIIQPLQT